MCSSLAHYIPDGRPASQFEIASKCRHYEHLMQQAGGIDLQLLGIGRNGHAGFNEPEDILPADLADWLKNSRTRRVMLAESTRQDAAAGFGGILEAVPRQGHNDGADYDCRRAGTGLGYHRAKQG